MKSPNIDEKLKSVRGCWNCDNYISGVKCSCKYSSRSSQKFRMKREVEQELVEMRYCDEYYPFLGPTE